MATLSERQRDRIPEGKFAYVDRDGGEHLPIHDESHVRNAISRFNQTDFESAAARERARRKILAAAKKYDIEVSEDSNVARGRATGRDRPRVSAAVTLGCAWLAPWPGGRPAGVGGRAAGGWSCSRTPGRRERAGRRLSDPWACRHGVAPEPGRRSPRDGVPVSQPWTDW